jgi:Alpha/beta hydrolase domain
MFGSCAVVALMIAGCSSDDNGKTAAPTTAASTTAASTTAVPTTPATDAPATDAPTISTQPTTDATVESTTAATDAPVESTTPGSDGEIASTTTIARLAGPVADLSEELTGGNGVFIAAGTTTGLEPGYVEHEFVASGTASSYVASGELTSDGMWTFAPDASAEYRTRVLVRRPENAADFSGVVIVEWLNVSGGLDANPDFEAMREEIIREGDVWVGVSAQAIGVEGGPVAVRVPGPVADSVVGKGLKGIDPARYGSLQHPGDAFSYDIFTQVARALRRGGAPLGDLEPGHVVAAGESQSAFAMVTYINGVQPLTHAFDGFFVHSRGAVGLALVPAGQPADIAGSFSGPPTILRTDTNVPIFELQTESDVAGILNSFAARQPDTDLFRLWEVAGTAHADAHTIGDNVTSIDCGAPINDGPLHLVAKAALHHFVAWVETGVAPPQAPLLDVSTDGAPAQLRDPDGIALGGLRTPPVDVPVRVLSSTPGPTDSIICTLLGSTNPISADRLAQLYTSRADYEQRYAAAADQAIAAGYVLQADRAALDGYAHPDLVEG